VRGEELDAKTDLFSFGIVLYEMATGSLPFKGSTTGVVFDEILNKPPTSPVRINPEVPDDLEKVITRSLEKDPQLRFQHASDLKSELMRLKRDTSGESVATSAVPAATPAKRSYLWPAVAGGAVVAILLLLALLLPFASAPAEAIDSIAVLPFENRSGDPELEYVSDGIAEGITHRLSQLSSLNKVISSSSLRRYKGEEVDAATVTQEVDARAIVLGSMVQLGENIRISVELVDGQNNSTLWGETYTRPRSALYELEETLSREIADALGIQLTGEEGERLSKRYTENVQAHEAYLKGQFEMSRGRFREALPHFEEAIEKDPNYAPAYAALARVYLFAKVLGIPSKEALPKAEELAMKALELDSSFAEAHSVLGSVQSGYYRNWVEAEKEHQLALELDPNSAEAHNTYAHHLGRIGRFDEAILLMKRAQQLNPSAIGFRVSSAMLFLEARRYEESIEQLQVVVDLQPNIPNAYQQLGRVYEVQGLYEEAATAFHRSLVLEGASEEEVAGLLDAGASGAEAYWRWQLDYDRERAKREHVESPNFAIFYAHLGEKDEAFEWLEKAFEEGENISNLKVHPEWDPLRSDPRFQDLLRRMNLEP